MVYRVAVHKTHVIIVRNAKSSMLQWLSVYAWAHPMLRLIFLSPFFRIVLDNDHCVDGNNMVLIRFLLIFFCSIGSRWLQFSNNNKMKLEASTTLTLHWFFIAFQTSDRFNLHIYLSTIMVEKIGRNYFVNRLIFFLVCCKGHVVKFLSQHNHAFVCVCVCEIKRKQQSSDNHWHLYLINRLHPLNHSQFKW